MPERKYILKSLILSGFCFLVSLVTFAQQYTFINYSTEQGLAQSQVSAMVQDEKGYLWFATFGGLSRFDGLEFTNYTKNDGLVENQLYSIFLDSKGDMWIGAVGAFSRFDGINFYSTRLPAQYQNYNVISFCESGEGEIWFALEGGGVGVFKKDQLTFFGEKDGIDVNVRTVFNDLKNNIFIGTGNGLYQFNRNTQLSSAKFERIKFSGFFEHNISCITETENNEIWIGTYDEGVFKGNFKNGFKNYTSENGLITDGVRTVFADRHNNIWFATRSGVSKFDGKEFRNFSTKEGLINNNIKFISEDSEGNVWFGTDGKGILKLAGEAFTTYTMAEGLPSDFVMSVAEDKNHALWFATYDKGIAKFNGSTYEWFNDENGLSNNTVWSCVVDRNNTVWIGTSFGLNAYDGKKITQYYRDEDGLLADKITALLADDDGTLWIGNRDGLSHMVADSFVNYGAEQGLMGGNIRGLMKDHEGNLWLGGTMGLYRFDGKKFTLFKMETGVENNTVYCIKEGFGNQIWVGAKSGLYLFRNDQFVKVPLGASVNANNINFMIFEDFRLWIGTNNGLYELNAKRFAEEGIAEYKNYSRLEGVRGLESNMNAAFRDSRGNYWFGTDGGLVNFNPKKRNETGNTVEPYIHITDIKLFFDPIDWKKYGKEIDSSTGFSKNLVVDYDKNHFTFYYTGISHTNPQKVKYRFMLEGFDQEWSPETDGRAITYSNLPHGHFTFKVIACNDSGIWSTVPATFSFTITPPFWLTWWFYSLVSIFGISIVVLIYRWRIAVIKRNTEREQLIYKSKLLSLEQQTLNASMNRHFIFNALNSIQYYINKQDKLEANRYLTSFAKLIRKNLDSSVSGNLVSLSEELERLELYLSLENMRFKNKFHFELFIHEDIDTESVKIPPMLLQPYVENSIWHGILPMEEPGTIWIKILPNDAKSIKIIISDNGIGINTSLKNKVAGGADHVSRGIEITSGRLAVLKKLTNENLRIEGPYELQGTDGKAGGTEVVLIIPEAGQLRNENFSEKAYE